MSGTDHDGVAALTSGKTAEPVVCPSWCVRHTPRDPTQGNPEDKWSHDGPRFTFHNADGGEDLTLDLTVILHRDGRPIQDEAFIYVDSVSVSIATAAAMRDALDALVRAEVESDKAPRPTVDYPCPEWCQTPVHEWFVGTEPDARPQRDHDGPVFGPFHLMGSEYADAPRAVRVWMWEPELGGNGEEMSPLEAREVARDAIAAAEWLEAHR